MKFLCDHDVYGATVQFLREEGHDVVTAAELGLAAAEDGDLLERARDVGRKLVTRDRDFGGLVFQQGHPAGVLYLRVVPSLVSEVHSELQRILARYSDEELADSFVVVEPGRHRIRRITAS